MVQYITRSLARVPYRHVSLKGTSPPPPPPPPPSPAHPPSSTSTQSASSASPRHVSPSCPPAILTTVTLQDKKSHSHRLLTAASVNSLSHPYGARYGTESLPKFHMPSKGTTPEVAYQLIHDELSTDGHPTLKSVYAPPSSQPPSPVPQPCLLCLNLHARACQQTHAREHVQEPH